MQSFRNSLFLVFFTLLTGCGGGSGDLPLSSSSTAPVPPAVEIPATVPVVADTPVAAPTITTGDALAMRSAGCEVEHPDPLLLPKEIVIEPDGLTALITEHGEGVAGRLSRVDLHTGRIQTIVSGMTAPEGVALAQDGKTAWVLESFTASNAGQNNRLLKVDLATCSFVVVAEKFHHTEGIVLESSGITALAVTGAFSGTISRINLITGAISTVIDHLSYPEGIAITADGRTAWVTQGFIDTISWVDLASGTVWVNFSWIITNPQRIVLEPGDRTALVTSESGSLVRLDLSNGTLQVLASGLNSPQGLALESNGNTLWVVEECAGLTQVDLSKGSRATLVATNGIGCKD